MERVMKVLLVLLAITCGATIGLLAFGVYVDSRYAETLTSTYLYEVTLVTDGPLSDLHLFLPLPVRAGGSSEVVSTAGTRGWTGIPEGWNVTLTGTEKYNLLEVSAPTVPSTGGCSACGEVEAPHVLTIPVVVRGPVDTVDPVARDEVLQPRRLEAVKACPDTVSTGDAIPRCTGYETRFFADYTTYPATTVVITVDLTGTNRWNIFGERWSRFRDTARLMILGESHGWQTARGELESSLGYTSLW